jgi:antirestriction protein ArdC
MHHLGIDRGYAANELIVQLMACYLGADMNVPIEEDLDNHVAYLGMWLKAMKASPSYILLASKDARRLSNHFMSKWHESKRRVA